MSDIFWSDQVQDAGRHFRTCSACRLRWEQGVQVYRLLQNREHRESPNAHDAAVTLPQFGVAYTAALSPLGILWIAAGPGGLIASETWTDEVSFVFGLERRLGVTPSYEPELLHDVAARFDEYFAGRGGAIELPLDFRRLPPFQQRVLEAVAQVPYGTVMSYRDIAIEVGKPLAARAVGTAVASNPLSIVVPCHRIVRSDGSPGEYALYSIGSCGVRYKLALLELEGYRFAA